MGHHLWTPMAVRPTAVRHRCRAVLQTLLLFVRRGARAKPYCAVPCRAVPCRAVPCRAAEDCRVKPRRCPSALPFFSPRRARACACVCARKKENRLVRAFVDSANGAAWCQPRAWRTINTGFWQRRLAPAGAWWCGSVPSIAMKGRAREGGVAASPSR